MAEKRTPTFVFLLRKRGKDGKWRRHKIEAFPAKLWEANKFANWHRIGGAAQWLKVRYRLRVDGKWYRNRFDADQALTSYEIRDLLWKAIGKQLG